MRCRIATTIMTVVLLAACSETTAPDHPAGIFVLTSYNSQSMPFVYEDERIRQTILADTLYLNADRSAELAITFKTDSLSSGASSVETWRLAFTYTLIWNGFELLYDPPGQDICICENDPHNAQFVRDGFILTMKSTAGETVYKKYERVQ